MSKTQGKPGRKTTSAKQSESPVQAENALLLKEARKIVEALGRMFAPCCEVVLHDLTNPEHAILAIECPLSGRRVGEPATEMGLARINDVSFPDVVQNYANTFPDGRPAKSTSIGIRNSQGMFVAAICLNLDISLFSSMKMVIEQLTSTYTNTSPVRETLRSRSLDEVRNAIGTYAAQRNTQPRALSTQQRREVILLLSADGLLQLRGAASAAAEHLGISRASLYKVLKSSSNID